MFFSRQLLYRLSSRVVGLEPDLSLRYFLIDSPDVPCNNRGEPLVVSPREQILILVCDRTKRIVTNTNFIEHQVVYLQQPTLKLLSPRQLCVVPVSAEPRSHHVGEQPTGHIEDRPVLPDHFKCDTLGQERLANTCAAYQYEQGRSVPLNDCV